jgi:hypothetical protein
MRFVARVNQACSHCISPLLASKQAVTLKLYGNGKSESKGKYGDSGWRRNDEQKRAR